MEPSNFAEGLKRNGILIVVFLAFVILAIVGWRMQGSDDQAPQAAGQTQPGGVPVAEAGPVDRPVRLTPQEEAREIIAGHQAKLDADRQSPDAPGYLLAMGNLYRQKLLDYEEAARCYSLLIHDYPDWEGVPHVYIQLVTCYERLNRLDDRNRVLEEIMNKLPPDSQEYLFAQMTLSP